MAFWIREATLVIGNKKYTLGELDFKFSIPFDDSDETPVATVTVTNLSANTRANIKKNDPVILNAGYEGDVGCILIGKVVGLRHKQSNTDWTSTLTVQPCADEILGKLINKTYVQNSKASAIVKDLLVETEQDEYFAKFNVDGLLRGDYQSRMNGYATGISNGFLSPNDIHRLENMDLIPAEDGGDDYYLNGGYVKLKDAGKFADAKQTAVEQNQPKEDEPDEGETQQEPDSENRQSESTPMKTKKGRKRAR